MNQRILLFMFCGIAVMASTAQSEMPDSAVVCAHDGMIADTDCRNVPMAQLSECDSLPHGSIFGVIICILIPLQMYFILLLPNI